MEEIATKESGMSIRPLFIFTVTYIFRIIAIYIYIYIYGYIAKTSRKTPRTVYSRLGARQWVSA